MKKIRKISGIVNADTLGGPPEWYQIFLRKLGMINKDSELVAKFHNFPGLLCVTDEESYSFYNNMFMKSGVSLVHGIEAPESMDLGVRHITQDNRGNKEVEVHSFH